MQQKNTDDTNDYENNNINKNNNKRQKIEQDIHVNTNKNCHEDERHKEDDKVLYYCDLGCNEGDLSLEIANEIQRRTMKASYSKVNCLGLDIDPELIHRANIKSSKQQKEAAVVTGTFQVCNLCNEQEHLSRCLSFLDGNSNSLNQRKFDLMSIFSTTMWIHIHSGDDGLKDFLKRSCAMTNMLLIEPQPSKCYRNVNVRLRKMHCSEVEDISTDRLTMRTDIENEIQKIICDCGFERVQTQPYIENKNKNKPGFEFESKIDSNSNNKKTSRTVWNRMLQLYIRTK